MPDPIVPPAQPGETVLAAYAALLTAIAAQTAEPADRAVLAHGAAAHLADYRDEQLAEAMLLAPGGPVAIAKRTGLPIAVVTAAGRRLPPEDA